MKKTVTTEPSFADGDRGAIVHLRRLNRVTLTDDILDQIVELVARGQLKPGDRLPGEHQLARTLGVARQTVREALRALIATGILERRGRATFVRPTLPGVFGNPLAMRVAWKEMTLRELFEARRAIEGELCDLAAQRATRDDLARIQRATEGFRTQGSADYGTMRELDRQFHRAVEDAAHSRLLAEAAVAIRELLWRQHPEVVEVRGIFPIALENHRRLVEAIRARSPVSARRVVHENLRQTERVFIRRLRRLPG